jgi:predicted enzyme related to lactoylglutathione lyase
MNEQVNALNWFEIPASNLARAKQFYETIFGIEMSEMEMMGTKMALFPAEAMSGKVSGAVVQGEMYQPSQDGAKIYLNGNPDLNNVLSKIVAAGGSIQMPKTHISPEIGHMAFFTDSEGNGVALHSNK